MVMLGLVTAIVIISLLFVRKTVVIVAYQPDR
jgi:hypothetical protein